MTISIVTDQRIFEYSCKQNHPYTMAGPHRHKGERQTGHSRICAHSPVHTEFMVLELITVVTFRRKGGVTPRWHVGLLGTGEVPCPDLEDVHVDFTL